MPATPAGGGTTTAGTNPQPLTSNRRTSRVIVQCSPRALDTDDLFVGWDDIQPIQLLAGWSTTIRTDNANRVYVRAGAGTVAYGWLGVLETDR